MTDNRPARFSILALCVLLLSGCGKTASDEIDYGTVKDLVYHNEYFGLNLALPSGWIVQDQEMRQQMVAAGAKIVAGDDKNLRAVLKASEQQTVYLLMASQHPVGSPVAFNPSFMCVAERVRHLPGIVRGSDYHFHTKKLLESSQMNVQFSEDISTVNLDGVDFDVMHVSMTAGPSIVQQKYYTAIMRDYALVFIVTFTTADEESVLQSVLEGVSFK
jgi:hypothetical protein